MSESLFRRSWRAQIEGHRSFEKLDAKKVEALSNLKDAVPKAERISKKDLVAQVLNEQYKHSKKLTKSQWFESSKGSDNGASFLFNLFIDEKSPACIGYKTDYALSLFFDCETFVKSKTSSLKQYVFMWKNDKLRSTGKSPGRPTFKQDDSEEEEEEEEEEHTVKRSRQVFGEESDSEEDDADLVDRLQKKAKKIQEKKAEDDIRSGFGTPTKTSPKKQLHEDYKKELKEVKNTLQESKLKASTLLDLTFDEPKTIGEDQIEEIHSKIEKFVQEELSILRQELETRLDNIENAIDERFNIVEDAIKKLAKK